MGNRIKTIGGVVLAVFFAAPLVFANGIYSTWVGGTGNWSVALNWNPAEIPRSSYQDGLPSSQGSPAVVNIPNVTDMVTLDASVYSFGAAESLTNWGTLTVTNSPGGTNGLVLGNTAFADPFTLLNYGTLNIQNGAYLTLDSSDYLPPIIPSYSNAINLTGNQSSMFFGAQGSTPTLNALNGGPSTVNFMNGTGMELRGLDGNGSGGRITFTLAGNLTASGASVTADNLDINAWSINASNGSTFTLGPATKYTGSFSIDGTSQINVQGLWSGYNGLSGTLSQAVNIGGTLQLGGDIVTVNAPLTLSGAGQIVDSAGHNALAGLQSMSGPLTLSNNASLTLNSLSSIGQFNLSGGSTLTSNAGGTFTLNYENTGYDPNYRSVIDGSTLSLPNATELLFTGGSGVTAQTLVFQNGATLSAPNLTKVWGGDGTMIVDGSNLNLSNALVATGVVTVRNGSLNAGSLFANFQLNVGDLPADYLGTTNTATFTSQGGYAPLIQVGPNSTVDFRGGAFLGIGSAGNLGSSLAVAGGTFIYDSTFGASGNITSIAAGAGLGLAGTTAEVLSWDGTSLHNALTQLGEIDGRLGISQGASLGFAGQTVVQGILQVGGAPAGLNVDPTIGGTYKSIGMDVQGTLNILQGGEVDITGGPIDNGVFQNLDANGTLQYGTFNIAGNFDYHGPQITTIGVDAIMNLTGPGAQITHHSSPGPGLGALSDIEGTLGVTGGATLTTTASLTDNGSLIIDGMSRLITNGFKMGANGSFVLDGTLESTGGVIDFGAGSVTLNGTVQGTVAGNIENTGNLNVYGGVTGNLTNDAGANLIVQGMVGGLLYNNGYFSPGDAPGETNAASYYQDSNGSLTMELDGYTQGTEYDFLNVSGAAQLDGELDVVFGNGVDLNQVGAVFQLIEWGSIDGSQFANIDLPTLDAGLEWVDTYSATGFTLEIESTNPSSAPEPGTWLMFGGGLVGLGAWRRVKRGYHE